MERAARQKSLTGVADLYGLYTVDHLTASLRTQWSYHQKFTNSLEESRHGILSALLLARKLRYFQEGEFTLDPTHQFSVEEARQFVIRREILRAVAGHTCPAIYLLHSLDLNAILFFADEIQEWGRPSFRELYASRSAADTPSVHVAKYTKDAVEYRVRAEGTVDELAALRWSLSAGRKIVDRLRSAPDASDRRFSVLWTLEWKTAGEEAWFQLRVPGSKPDDGRRSSAVCKKGAKDVDAQKYLDELLTGEKLAAVASRLREALRA